MYHAHFGLERGLFGEGIAADGAVFRSAKHDRLIAHFKLALASPSAVIVLHGPAGVGKTTLTAAALRASSTRLALAWLNGMPTNAAELLELILVELGINTLRTTRIERLQLWRQFQAETRATDSRLFIVAEVSEDMSPEVLHALDQLTAPDAVGNPGANLVLLGHAGLGTHLADPLLDSLRQRIRLRAELEPFTEAELQDYLRHQVACAAGSYERIFAPGTVAALFRYSRGVARLANTLCESALDIAAVQQQKQLTPELVAKTAVSLLGLAEPVPVARPAVTTPRVETPPAVETRPPRPAVTSTASIAAPAAAPPVAAPVAPAPAVVSPVPAVVSPAAAVVAPAAERPSEPAAAAPATSTPAIAPPPPAAQPLRAAIPAATPPASAAPVAPAAPAPAAPPAAAAPSKTAEAEYDGGATDVADVALADFPVLTDAIELPSPPPVAKPAPPPVAKAAPAPPPVSATAAPPAAAQPSTRTVNRAEPAQTVSRPAPPRPAAPTASPPPPAAATAPAAARMPAPKPEEQEDDDALRQTQTMRAIAAAKSIDDISDADAETLFGDAELDLVSAALASAAEWPDDDDFAPAAAPPPAATKTAPKPETPKPAAPADDPFDLFGLGNDAPLELMDDSTLPPASPARRTAIR